VSVKWHAHKSVERFKQSLKGSSAHCTSVTDEKQTTDGPRYAEMGSYNIYKKSLALEQFRLTTLLPYFPTFKIN